MRGCSRRQKVARGAEDRLGGAERLLEVDEEVLVEVDKRLLVVEIDVEDVVVVGTRIPTQALGLLIVLEARS